jgi:uncharacterized membrane protein YkvA (DUF1232 family)
MSECCCALYSQFKQAVKKLKRELIALYYATQDPRVGCCPRLLAAIALAYALSPLDLIPDCIPILGLVDDLIILPVLFWLAIRMIPPEIMEEARARAAAEPLRLEQNIPAAVVFGVIWLVCLLWLSSLGIEHLGSPAWRSHESMILAIEAVAFVTLFTGTLLYMLRPKPPPTLPAPSAAGQQLGAPLLTAGSRMNERE